MKFSSKLWMLAVALATVGCQDDIENGPNNGNGNGIDGPTTYMKVAVNSEVTTKAPQTTDDVPQGGEGEDTEVGSVNEYDVDDVTIVLYSPANANITSTSTIAAVGFANVGGTSASAEDEHSREATVQVTVTDDSEDSFDGQTYGIIAITNLGDDNAIITGIEGGTITTGANLADYLQKSAWSGSNANKFIMSSHMPNAETVTLRADATPEDAPNATVHVERLAAKIRINETANTENFIYTVGENTAKVRLDQVAIVNQLNSGTYMLKRVSNETSDLTTIPAAPDTYLGDEVWVKAGECNYVIDPWTRYKVSTNASNPSSVTFGSTSLSYINHFAGDSYEAMWTAFTSDPIDLASNTNITSDAPYDLVYTQENTTGASASLNGYSTGALFKATYFPAQWSAINAAGSAVEAENVPGYADVDVDATSTTFYVYQGNVYKDYDAIWAEYVWSLYGETMSGDALDYDDFKSANITNVTLEEFNASVISQGADPLGYIAYLNSVKASRIDNFTAADSFETYCEAHPRGTTDGTTDGTAINVYENGEMYYPYWIRHGNNGISTEMGIMEFAIVRNNIYDMTVSSISGFGKSSIDKPNPEEENEKEELFFNVRLLVRDWVVRSNSGIIL